ncbi:MAG TPA: TolC family protein [Bacteroides sp.]|nr:TolC family protein [Bacteroides sp.]
MDINKFSRPIWKNILILPAFILTIPYVSFSQSLNELDLDRSIALATERSHPMRILQEGLEQSKYELRAATSRFKTHVDIDFVIPNYTETVREWEDSTGITFFPVKQLRTSGYLTINQPLPTDGYIFWRSGIYNIEDFDRSERLTQVNSRIGFRQPLTALYSYNHIRSEFKRAKLNYELALKGLKRAELELIYDISQAFYETTRTKENMRIAHQTLEHQQEATKIAKEKYNAGLIREVESLVMDIDLAQALNEVDMSTVEYFSQLNYFKKKLGLQLSDSIILVSELTYNIVKVDEELAVSHGLASRIELREHEIGIELSEIEIKRRRSMGHINGEVTGYYDFIGNYQVGMPYPIGESLGNTWSVLKSRPGNFGVAFTVNIPLIDWGENKAYVRAAQSGLKMNMISFDEERINIEMEIRNTVRQLQSSLRRLQLLEQNLVVAEKSFNISRQRFANGDIDSQSLALDRNRLNLAYIAHLNAFVQYKLNIADLMRKSFFDFESGVSVIQGEI